MNLLIDGGDNRYMKRAKAILRCALCSEMAEHGGVGSASEPHIEARYWVGDCCIQANEGDMGRVTDALNEKFKKKKDEKERSIWPKAMTK